MVLGNPFFFVSTGTGSNDSSWSASFRGYSAPGFLGLGEERKEGEVGATSENADDDEVSCPPGVERGVQLLIKLTRST